MAANARRGEISAEFDGKPFRLCLTLGALAELENAFGAGDLNALAERFGTGRLSAKDMMEIIAAGMRGGGARSMRRSSGGCSVRADLAAMPRSSHGCSKRHLARLRKQPLDRVESLSLG